jgi:hypothetical protein
LFEWARAAGSIYQNHLQQTLSSQLGVAWGPDRNNTREMDGFTRAQRLAFSKRSAQIEAELEAKGAMYESPALRMQADDEASLATRTAKDHSLTPSLLAGRWQREAEQVGLAAGTDPEIGLSSRSARLHPGGCGRARLRYIGRPAHLRGDHRHGRPVRRLRAGGAPDP